MGLVRVMIRLGVRAMIRVGVRAMVSVRVGVSVGCGRQVHRSA